MNSILVKILSVIFSAFAIIYFGYQAYMFTYDPYKTEVALIHSYTDQIEINGIAIKEEEVFPDPASGVIKYRDTNSKKVVAGTTVASVFANEKDVETSSLIDKKQSQIVLLSELEEKKSTIGSNTQNIVKNIKQQQVEFITKVATNDFSDMTATENLFLSQMLKQQIVLNGEISFQTQIDALHAEVNSLKAQMTSEGTNINVDQSGYFTDEIDGYENLVTTANLEDLSLETVNNLINTKAASPEGKHVGKIVTSSEWYFLATFDTKEKDRLKEGKTISLVFPNNDGFSINATIKQLNISADKDQKSVMLLRSSNMNDVVVNLRAEHASVVFDTNKGIKAPKSAVRIVELKEENADGVEQTISQPGVYVSMGQVVKFKKVDIQYESEEYVISKPNEDSSYLQLYDDIILEGGDLYDNKPIR